MLKKSCLVVCLLASAASASQNGSWDGEFTMGNGTTIHHTSDGVFKEIKGIPGRPSPVLSLLRIDPKNEDDTVELEAAFTPRTFLKTLEQTGEVVGIKPPSLAALLRQPTAQPAQTEEQHFIDEFSQRFAGLLGREEIVKVWKNLRGQSIIETTSPQNVIRDTITVHQYMEEVVDPATGETKRYDVTRETNWLDSVGNDFPLLDMPTFRNWYTAQKGGTIAGIGDYNLMEYVWRSQHSNGAASFQQFSQEKAAAMEQIIRARTIFPAGPLNFDEHLLATRAVNVYK